MGYDRFNCRPLTPTLLIERSFSRVRCLRCSGRHIAEECRKLSGSRGVLDDVCRQRYCKRSLRLDLNAASEDFHSIAVDVDALVSSIVVYGTHNRIIFKADGKCRHFQSRPLLLPETLNFNLVPQLSRQLLCTQSECPLWHLLLRR